MKVRINLTTTYKKIQMRRITEIKVRMRLALLKRMESRMIPLSKRKTSKKRRKDKMLSKE